MSVLTRYTYKIVGAMQNLPVVDGDLMGRAFPELNMTSQYIFGNTLVPCSIADDKVALKSSSVVWVSRLMESLLFYREMLWCWRELSQPKPSSLSFEV